MCTLPLTWILFTTIRAVPIKGIANLADSKIFTSSVSQSKLARMIRCFIQIYIRYNVCERALACVYVCREETGLGRSVQ